METPSVYLPVAGFDKALATVLGLRVGYVGEKVVLPAVDAKLYRLALNPKTKVTEKFRYSRGVHAVYIGGLYTHSGEAYPYLDHLAFRLPHLPHFAQWRDLFA